MSLVGFLFLLPAAIASDASQLRIFADPANLKHETAALKVNLVQESCFLNREKASKSTAVAFEACHSIVKILKERKLELNKIAQLKFGIDQRQKYEGAHLPLILLEIDGQKFPVLKTGAEVCDASGNSCRPESTLASDQLGFQVLKLLR